LSLAANNKNDDGEAHFVDEPEGRHEPDRSLRASIRGPDAARYPSTCLGRGPAVLRHHLDGNSRVLAAMKGHYQSPRASR
jgi:hypothetical protein